MNEAYKKLGNTLIDKGAWFLQKSFDLNPEKVSGVFIRGLVSGKTGISPNNIYLADDIYYCVDLDKIKEILQYDLISEKEYESEKFDCDDFSQTIYAIFRYVFELNSMGTARQVEIVDPKTGKNTGWHRANLFVAKENGVYGVFYLEPQTDTIVELGGKEIELFGAKYVLNSVDF